MRKTVLKGMYKEKQQGNEYKVPVEMTERRFIWTENRPYNFLHSVCVSSSGSYLKIS